MRAQLLHLTGPLRGRTVTYDAQNLLIGTDPDATVRFRVSDRVAARHAEIAFVEAGCAFYLRPIGGKVFVNRAEIEEVILAPDDLVEFGVGGPRVRFRIQEIPGRVCKPVRKMLRDARDVGRESGAFGFTGSMTRDLLTHATPQLKIGVPLFVVGLSVLMFVAGWFGAGRSHAEHASEILALREQVAELRASQAFSANSVAKMREELERKSAVLDELRAEDAAVERIHGVMSRGVCLLHGVYGFRLPGRSPQFVTDADGSRLESEYTGSGFRATRSGRVVTNRHVVRPWEYDEEARMLVGLGYRPEMLRLTASFPGRDPIEVDVRTVRVRQDTLDVAAVTVVVEDDVPILELSDADPVALRGTRVLVVGYPTGVNALLAKAEQSVVSRVMAGGPELSLVIDRLARDGAISPLVTAGILSDVQAESLVYDADTTSGGSGGPVFGRDGRVIAVNYAVVPQFSGSNLGVPIRFVRVLLN